MECGHTLGFYDSPVASKWTGHGLLWSGFTAAIRYNCGWNPAYPHRFNTPEQEGDLPDLRSTTDESSWGGFCFQRFTDLFNSPLAQCGRAVLPERKVRTRLSVSSLKRGANLLPVLFSSYSSQRIPLMSGRFSQLYVSRDASDRCEEFRSHVPAVNIRDLKRRSLVSLSQPLKMREWEVSWQIRVPERNRKSLSLFRAPAFVWLTVRRAVNHAISRWPAGMSKIPKREGLPSRHIDSKRKLLPDTGSHVWRIQEDKSQTDT